MNQRDKDKSLLRDLHALGRLQPDAEATARAIERARAAVASTVTRRSSQRRNIMSLRNVAAVAASLLVIALLTHWLAPTRATSGLAFAEMQQQVEKTKSVQYLKQRTIRMKGETKPFQLETRRVWILGSHQIREEIKITLAVKGPQEYMSIQNLQTGKQIDLYPETKAYRIPRVTLGLVSAPAPAAPQEEDLYRRVREIPAGEVEKLPGREIAGRMTEGFRVIKEIRRGDLRTDTWSGTYWVDPATKLPVRIEYSVRSNSTKAAESDTILSDFVFDAPLDEALFSTDPPEGYNDAAPMAK